MIHFIYSDETASTNIADALKVELGFKEAQQLPGVDCFESENAKMLGIKGRLIDAEFIDRIVDGPIVFLSRHMSSKGIAAFTVHPEGNWSDEASLGGKPKELSNAYPLGMLNMLNAIKELNSTNIELTYEATHHGPFTNNPSLFVELGGNEEAINSKSYAALLAKAIAASIEKKSPYDKVAVGIGSLHYPSKFTKLALEGKYAFSHIMSRHSVAHVDMLGKAFERSDLKAEVAVIEWKGINAAQREVVLRELNVLGIDYAKV